MKYLDGRNIGLDGVVTQQKNYQKSGFKLAYRNIRYTGISGGDFRSNSLMVDLSRVPFNDVYNYDRKFFPDDRLKFLMGWISQPKVSALVL